jgi:hypothetical protein
LTSRLFNVSLALVLACSFAPGATALGKCVQQNQYEDSHTAGQVGDAKWLRADQPTIAGGIIIITTTMTQSNDYTFSCLRDHCTSPSSVGQNGRFQNFSNCFKPSADCL